MTPNANTQRSNGHLGWIYGDRAVWEVYATSTDVYRAPMDNAFDVDTGNRIGRWECTVECLNRYGTDVVLGPGFISDDTAIF